MRRKRETLGPEEALPLLVELAGPEGADAALPEAFALRAGIPVSAARRALEELCRLRVAARSFKAGGKARGTRLTGKRGYFLAKDWRGAARRLGFGGVAGDWTQRTS